MHQQPVVVALLLRYKTFDLENKKGILSNAFFYWDAMWLFLLSFFGISFTQWLVLCHVHQYWCGNKDG